VEKNLSVLSVLEWKRNDNRSSGRADEIHPSSNGQSVTAAWKRWVVVGAKAGETYDPSLVAEVTWSITKDGLRWSEITHHPKQ